MPHNKRCLIVERHIWETGGGQQQLQFVLRTARTFFGPGRSTRHITINVLPPPDIDAQLFRPFTKNITISREYGSATRRTNGFKEIGSYLQDTSAFIFFEETDDANVYNVWWQYDKAIVAARFTNWVKGGDSQYGRGRLSIIVTAPVQRPINSP